MSSKTSWIKSWKVSGGWAWNIRATSSWAWISPWSIYPAGLQPPSSSGLGAWTSNPITFVDGSKASLPEDTQGLINAITYLMDKTQGLPVPVDPETEVAVLGGGFTTFDCTRTSLRLGAKVHTAYRRGR